MVAEPGLGIRAQPPRVALGLDAEAVGAREHLLAAEGLPDSFLLHGPAPCVAGRIAGPRVLALGRRLDVEVVEALHGPRRPQRVVDEAARRTVQESPQRR